MNNLGRLIPLSHLKPWEKNPRGAKKEDIERLKRQIVSLGQYKPLLVMNDGTVLGGNMRLEALGQLNQREAWCSVIEFVKEKQKWVVLINGKKNDKKTFNTKEQGMLEYALSDNDRVGYYEDQALAELLESLRNSLPLQDYKVDMGYSVDLQKLLDGFGPADTKKDVDDLETRQLDVWINNDIKQIILYFSKAEFEGVIKRMEAVREEFKVKNNTEAFLKLLEFYENNRKK